MTNKEKQLLLIDLCVRLPYLVKVNYNNLTDYILDVKLMTTHFVEKMKPYLRPLEDMTEEELKEFYIIEYSCEHPMVWKKPQYNWRFTVNGIDWLNKKMFDYRGLIPMGLALPAPEGMYKGNTK